ncbi:MAG: 4-hydroxy-tetrahydrodipicolinate reductase, partial [Gallionellaceae bacterium]|nr:4-hydroxy-tetrahydrodipicolinate reductase [Gallionellaceae bacterium]
MNKVKVVIAGCSGRMGRVLLECVAQTDDLALHAVLDHASSSAIGKDAGEYGGTRGVTIGADVATALRGADVLIDFTRPEGTL